MSRLSIIVVNWNGEELLPGCLDPLEGAGFDVIVVDNASTDASRALLNSQYGWVRVIANDKNLGFAVANNQGLALATGEYALLLNNDTVPQVVAVAEVVTFLDEHPNVGIAGPSLCNPDGTRQASCGPGPNLGTELLGKTLLHRVLPGIRTRAPDATCRVDWVTGAALFVRRSLADELGGLDEGMFMFYEDLDLCARVRERGQQVWFVATEPIVHIGGASRRKVEAQSLVHSYRSTDRFFARHGPAWRRYLLRVLTLGEVALRSVVWSVLWLFPGRRAQARERLRGYRTIARLTCGVVSRSRAVNQGTRSTAGALHLRPVVPSDAELLFTLRNDPDAVSYSETGRPVALEEHQQWFDRCLADTATRIWIGEVDGEPVGQTRVDVEGAVGTVSIAVVPARRGHGYGTGMLLLLQRFLRADDRVATLVARIDRDNHASRRVFERAGFVCTDVGPEPEFLTFRWMRDVQP